MRNRARLLYTLHALLALVGVLLAVVTLATALHTTVLTMPSTARIIASCGAWLQLLSSPLHLAIVISYGLALAVVYRGASAAWRIARDTRAFVRSLPPAGDLSGHPAVRVFDDVAARAFCAGLLRPKVYISIGAIELLSDSERCAVLAHELEHATRRDPLRLFTARVLTKACFFIPGVGRLECRCEALAELAADEAAISATGDRGALAAAILTLGESGPGSTLVAASPERVEHLLGGTAHRMLPRAAVTSASAVIIGLSVLVIVFARATAGTRLPFASLAMQACNPVMFGLAGLVAVNARRRLRSGLPLRLFAWR